MSTQSESKDTINNCAVDTAADGSIFNNADDTNNVTINFVQQLSSGDDKLFRVDYRTPVVKSSGKNERFSILMKGSTELIAAILDKRTKNPYWLLERITPMFKIPSLDIQSSVKPYTDELSCQRVIMDSQVANYTPLYHQGMRLKIIEWETVNKVRELLTLRHDVIKKWFPLAHGFDFPPTLLPSSSSSSSLNSNSSSSDESDSQLQVKSDLQSEMKLDLTSASSLRALGINVGVAEDMASAGKNTEKNVTSNAGGGGIDGRIVEMLVGNASVSALIRLPDPLPEFKMNYLGLADERRGQLGYFILTWFNRKPNQNYSHPDDPNDLWSQYEELVVSDSEKSIRDCINHVRQLGQPGNHFLPHNSPSTVQTNAGSEFKIRGFSWQSTPPILPPLPFHQLPGPPLALVSRTQVHRYV